MSEQTQANEPEATAVQPALVAPVTGHHDIDRALAGLELDADVRTHPEALSGVLDAVAQALSGQLPTGLRPRP